MSHYLVILLIQTTLVKTQPIAHVTRHNSRLVICWCVYVLVYYCVVACMYGFSKVCVCVCMDISVYAFCNVWCSYVYVCVFIYEFVTCGYVYIWVL